MELLILGGIIWFVIWLIKSSAEKDDVSSAVGSINQRFQAHAEVGMRTIQGESYPVFNIEVRGALSVPRDGYECSFFLHIFDITDGKAKPVFCAIDQLQDLISTCFEYRSDPQRIPYSETVVSEWLTVCSIPIDSLTFARKGIRKLRFSLDLVCAKNPPIYVLGHLLDGKSGSLFAHATTDKSYSVEELGYEDQRENHHRIEEMTIRLAMAVSAVDGHMAVQEGEVVRDWLVKRVGAIDDDEQKKEEKRRYNGYVEQAHKDASSDQISMNHIVAEINAKANTPQKYDALELCLHVAGADGTAEDSELDLIRDLARKLSINYDRLRSMEEKILPVSIHANKSNTDELLGISSAMSPAAVRKHLNKEYRKWNNRQSSKDPDVRKQAIEMLKLIAETRQKYVG